MAGFAVFALLIIGGAGFYFAKGFGNYRSEFNGWDDLASKIKRLEREAPYPNTANKRELENQLGNYEKGVNSLYESLSKFQKPLDQAMLDRDFPQKLKTRVEGFLELAGEKGMTIESKEDFYLGFDAYGSSLPKPGLVPLLNYQLDATHHLLKQLVESGATRLDKLSREMIPGEDPSAEKSDPGSGARSVVQKFPIKLDFAGRHQAFQDFVNRVANDEEYFFVLRALRIENSAPTGPIIEGEGNAVFMNEAGEVASQELRNQTGEKDLSWDEFVRKMADLGYRLVSQDARILFGEEEVQVEAVVDLVRFLSPEEVGAREE